MYGYNDYTFSSFGNYSTGESTARIPGYKEKATVTGWIRDSGIPAGSLGGNINGLSVKPGRQELDIDGTKVTTGTKYLEPTNMMN